MYQLEDLPGGRRDKLRQIGREISKNCVGIQWEEIGKEGRCGVGCGDLGSGTEKTRGWRTKRWAPLAQSGDEVETAKGMVKEPRAMRSRVLGGASDAVFAPRDSDPTV